MNGERWHFNLNQVIKLLPIARPPSIKCLLIQHNTEFLERLYFHFFTFMHWRRKWQPTPVFLPRESHGQGSLVAAVYGVAQSRTRLKRLSSSRNCVEFLPKIFNQNFIKRKKAKKSRMQTFYKTTDKLFKEVNVILKMLKDEVIVLY